MGNVFDHREYVSYLSERLGDEGRRSGKRLASAKAMGCHPAYLSRIMKRQADLSLEQADRLNEHFAHSEDESHFFFLLVQKARAGSKRLRFYFQDQLEKVAGNRQIIKNRVKDRAKLTPSHEAIYYSHWHYSAIHVLLAVDALRTADALAEYLHLPRERIVNVLDFLSDAGLAEYRDGKYRDRPGAPAPGKRLRQHFETPRKLADSGTRVARLAVS